MKLASRKDHFSQSTLREDQALAYFLFNGRNIVSINDPPEPNDLMLQQSSLQLASLEDISRKPTHVKHNFSQKNLPLEADFSLSNEKEPLARHWHSPVPPKPKKHRYESDQSILKKTFCLFVNDEKQRILFNENGQLVNGTHMRSETQSSPIDVIPTSELPDFWKSPRGGTRLFPPRHKAELSYARAAVSLNPSHMDGVLQKRKLVPSKIAESLPSIHKSPQNDQTKSRARAKLSQILNDRGESNGQSPNEKYYQLMGSPLRRDPFQASNQSTISKLKEEMNRRRQKSTWADKKEPEDCSLLVKEKVSVLRRIRHNFNFLNIPRGSYQEDKAFPTTNMKFLAYFQEAQSKKQLPASQRK